MAGTSHGFAPYDQETARVTAGSGHRESTETNRDLVARGRLDSRYALLCQVRREMKCPVDQIRSGSRSSSAIRSICRSGQAVNGLISAGEMADATKMDRRHIREEFQRLYRGNIPFAKGQRNAKDEALMAAAEADVPLVDSSTGWGMVPGEACGRHVAEPRVVDTAAACEASMGTQVRTDEVREVLPIPEHADHIPGWGTVLAPMPVGTPIQRPLLFMSTSVHHAATDTDGGRIPRHLREDRMSRLMEQLAALLSERKAVTENLRAEVDASNGLRSQLVVLSKEVAALRAEAARLREDGHSRALEMGLMRQELAVAKDRRARAEADNALLKGQISDLQKSADLRKLLRESQVARGVLERELRSLKEDMTRKDSELVKLQEDLRVSELRARNASESQGALSNECGRLRVMLELREEKASQEAELRSRHPFFYEHMDFLRRKAGVGEERALAYPHMGRLGDNDVDWHGYYVLMSQIGEYYWKYSELLLGFPSWRTVQRWRKDLGDELELAYDAFDGSDANVAVLIRLVKERLQVFNREDQWKVAVACEAVSLFSSRCCGGS